jgi:ABC-type transport system substrate-binding protein
MDWDIDYYQLWHSSQADVQGGSNHCGFKDARMDALADRLRTTFDLAERVRIAKEAQAILHEQQPYLFFRAGEGVFIWQNRAPAGSTARERYLDGVTRGLDEFHPLVNRSRAFWCFAR